MAPTEANTQPMVQHGVGFGFPVVRGRCPSCRLSSLFLGAGGYVTCASLTCPDPGAASDLLTGEPTKDERCPNDGKALERALTGDPYCPVCGYIAGHTKDKTP